MRISQSGPAQKIPLAELPADDWNRLVGNDQPALQQGFLQLLESTGAACPSSGWTPRHQVIQDPDGRLMAGMPVYEKQHSFGEFVFDFALADAWQRSGLSYYPKLLVGIPFTPLIGPRLPGNNIDSRKALAASLEAEVSDGQFSTAHVLFPEEEEASLLERRGWIRREGCRFQWFNQGFDSFEDWLSCFRSKKRKNLRQERRQVASMGIRFEWRDGSALSTVDWDRYYPLYAATYWRRGQAPYLSQAFFVELCQRMPEAVLLIEAWDSKQDLIALAFCLKGEHTLYGRHWGCSREIDKLHFETCYHQGIEYCIDRGLNCFDPGTQGEHKLLRGFEPVTTSSLHWIPDNGLRQPVADFAARERDHNAQYLAAARAHLPFHRIHGDGE